MLSLSMCKDMHWKRQTGTGAYCALSDTRRRPIRESVVTSSVNNMPEIVVQRPVECKECIEIIAEAMQDDNFARLLHGGDRDARLACWNAFVPASMIGREDVHRVYRTSGLECAMYVYKYPEGEPTGQDIAASGLLHQGMIGVDQERVKTARAILELYEHAKEELHAVHGSFLVINYFGTRPAHQGRGLGSAVMKRACGDADEAGLPMFLLTFNTNNSVTFYEKIGFCVVDQLSIEGSDLTAYYMARRPSSPI